ncbi:uncharacterized protein LOC134183368 [Corticium candelabrum]|uniref:uncharacterized protein LOC134183368 n=1 Tax=Corticium candelabrum TaxID=121492 RepID=UPI002E259FB3|nr:uncharacterized protein LOC134183368 [Corticium candelabrum]
MPTAAASNWKHYLRFGLTLFHSLVATGIIALAILEFTYLPPFFDVAGDRIGIKDVVFENDPRTRSHDYRRMMDIPILVNTLAYFMLCVYLRFTGMSIFLTMFISTIVLSFIVVNYSAYEYFNWNFFSQRLGSVVMTICFLTASMVANLVVYAWKRKKPYIEVKPREKDIHRRRLLTSVHRLSDGEDSAFSDSLSTATNWQETPYKSRIATFVWNAIILFIIIFVCLLIWFSRMYMSYCCFTSREEILALCQMTNEVQCYPCSSCTSDVVNNCSNDTNMFHCLSPMYDVDKYKGAICMFNYNVGFFSLVLVLAYIGGVYFISFNFIGAFSNLVFQWCYRLDIWCRRHCCRGQYQYISSESKDSKSIQRDDV